MLMNVIIVNYKIFVFQIKLFLIKKTKIKMIQKHKQILKYIICRNIKILKIIWMMWMNKII